MEMKKAIKVEFFDGKEMYSCLIKKQKCPDNMELPLFDGEHVKGKTDMDVTKVWFINCQIRKVPQNLTKIFPNLQNLMINNSNLKTLTKADLAEYKNFKNLNFGRNKLEFLYGDLFEGFVNLEIILFYDNQLKMIESGILNGLDKLKDVDFRDNLNYNEYYSTIYSNNSNVTLAELKQQLFNKSVKLFVDRAEVTAEAFGKKFDELKDNNEKVSENLKASKIKIKELEDVNEQLSIQPKRSSTSDLKSFIQQDETLKDFHIYIKDQKFAVHKVLLAARSPVFAEMFKTNSEAANLELIDISVNIFEKILKFLYTDEFPVDETDFMYLFAAAGRLQIEELKNHAAVKLLEQINAENAFECLKLSNKYQHDKLRQKAFDEIKKKYPQVYFKDELAVKIERMKDILDLLKKKEEHEKKFNEDFKNLMKK